MPEFKHTPEQARKLWVEALRSGEYEQWRGGMRNHTGGHCCLDVARIACEKAEGLQFPLDNLSDAHLSSFPLVRVWLGLRTETGDYYPHDKDGVTCLASQNDLGKPFPEIADIIESAPPGLFVEPSNA